MAHLLHRFGAKALLPRKKGDKILPPLISFENALKLREQFYAIGFQWPYENIVPGKPQLPPGSEAYAARQREKEQKRAAREKEIADAMAAMPKRIAEYRESRKLDWSEVSALDRLLLTPGQIREKYVRRRLMRQNQ
ncbi:hypothetical protein Vretimale_14861 [Volvox reticuliferus]|uniref:Uncharacterized protein n=1 Tax=Volvox reticuliferus TaxID=1737510 RepID=A0A8J4FYE7_9CHLO|nr:hypothetical protein Vretifemale_19316 [Volvox reticuliferus]GIM11341.1 hypothetical protein Vretimale_14861 [Volvox reticuliferus]